MAGELANCGTIFVTHCMQIAGELANCNTIFATYYVQMAGEPANCSKAGVIMNQCRLYKLILLVHCLCFSVLTSQKLAYLVTRTGRYNVPLQLLIGKILKYLVLMGKKKQ
jgi:hypothetical protein